MNAGECQEGGFCQQLDENFKVAMLESTKLTKSKDEPTVIRMSSILRYLPKLLQRKENDFENLKI